MTMRRTPPNRRAHCVLQFEHHGLEFTAGFVFFEDGSVGETVLSGRKIGSCADAADHDAAVVASLALLQHVPLSTIGKGVRAFLKEAWPRPLGAWPGSSRRRWIRL